MPRPDFTDKYNTKLSPEDEVKFRKDFPNKDDLYDYDLRGAWKAGAKQSANGHLTDEFKKPNHPTFSDESKYNGVDGYKGGSWKQNGDKWSFNASQSNLDNMPASDLNNYFQRVEPGNQLIFPGTAANELMKPAKSVGAVDILQGQN